SLSFALSGTGGEATFESDVFEEGVFEGGGESVEISIDPATGIITLDTKAIGLINGVEVIVIATNSGGSDSATLAVTVEEGVPAETMSLTLTELGHVFEGTASTLPMNASDELEIDYA